MAAASCRLCGDDQLEELDLCAECALCELCCTCAEGFSQDELSQLRLADELSDMQDDDRGYYWERYGH